MNHYDQFIVFLEYLEEKAVKPGLERIASACGRMGNPERQFRSIHIAGTNGKGSTARYLQSILNDSGYKTALYTSPHLISVSERIKVNDDSISNKKLGDYFNLIMNSIDNCDLSYFELLTLISFLYFRDESIDIAVYETGLGGKWDATNVISPIVSVLTPISKDHVNYLGYNLLEIASEKFGIIKKNIPVISAEQDKKVKNDLIQYCKKVGSELHFMDNLLSFDNNMINLSYQRENASLAVTVAKFLNRRGYPNSGLIDESVRWPGRLQILSNDPLIIADGAHNRTGCRKLAEYISKRYPEREKIVVFAALKDKDIDGMIDEMSELADYWIIYDLNSPRFDLSLINEGDVGHRIVSTVKSVDEAVEAASSLNLQNSMIIVTGSLYLVGEFLDYFKGN